MYNRHSFKHYSRPLWCPAGLCSRTHPILAYINDLPEQIRSRVRLFADDTALYLCISNLSRVNTIQEDLCKLELWEEAWNMNFNPTLCQVLHITRLKTPIPSKYFFHGIELECVSAAKFIGAPFWTTLVWERT